MKINGQHKRRDAILATRLGEILHGEKLIDVALACCTVMAFAVREMKPESRNEAMRIMLKMAASIVDDDREQSLQ